jgi:hypothetical protein
VKERKRKGRKLPFGERKWELLEIHEVPALYRESLNIGFSDLFP